MAKKDHRNNKSVCEISMMVVANIITLSSVKLAGPCFTTNLTAQDHETDVPMVGKDNTTSATKLSNKSQRSQGPERSKKPRSYLMKPEKEVGPTIVRQEINDANVDVSAENYISHVRGKIEKDANTATTTKRFSSAAIHSSTSSSK